MSITHTDPLANLRMFEDAFSRLLSEPRTGRPWSPAVDIFETENELVLKADLPDVDLKDIEVRVENQTLTIKGERKFEQDRTPRAITASSAATALSSAASPSHHGRHRKGQRGVQKRRPYDQPAEERSRQAPSGKSRSQGLRLSDSNLHR